MSTRPSFPAWACPHCSRSARNIDAAPQHDSTWRCPGCATEYACIDGVWDFLSPDRLALYATFLKKYQAIRQAEGRAEQTGDYYRSLPFIDLHGPIGDQWKVRAKTFRALVAWLATESDGQMRIADLGAGCAWLSHRLTALGHQLVAVDLLAENEDGLGSARHYPTRFGRTRAEFDHLPFDSRSLDLVIYNGSFHYSNSFEDTLREGLRTLTPKGVVVILDSPVFHHSAAGRLMLAEQEKKAAKLIGNTEALTLSSEGFLTRTRWQELGSQLGLFWERIDVRQSFRWELEPLRRRLFGLREPARFPLLVARRTPR